MVPTAAKARVLACPVKTLRSMAPPEAIRHADPTPERVRAMSSTMMLPARPDPSAPAPKHPAPIWKTRRRPAMSAIAPVTSISAEAVRK